VYPVRQSPAKQLRAQASPPSIVLETAQVASEMSFPEAIPRTVHGAVQEPPGRARSQTRPAGQGDDDEQAVPKASCAQLLNVNTTKRTDSDRTTQITFSARGIEAGELGFEPR
jgi:hypothetical protein